MNSPQSNNNNIHDVVLKLWMLEGKCYTSFPQIVCVGEGGMGWQDRVEAGVHSQNLAANVLAHVVPPNNLNHAILKQFIDDILVSMDAEGGDIPIDVIDDWYKDISRFSVT